MVEGHIMLDIPVVYKFYIPKIIINISKIFCDGANTNTCLCVALLLIEF